MSASQDSFEGENGESAINAFVSLDEPFMNLSEQEWKRSLMNFKSLYALLGIPDTSLVLMFIY
jgi:hypothetical protein